MAQDPSYSRDLSALNDKRRAIRHLLSPADPADALTSYYALWHDPRRTKLSLHYDAQHRVDGFVTISQTGADLFRPLVTFRAPDGATAGELLHTALATARPYQVIVPVALASAVREQMNISQASIYRVYQLNASRFQPTINVLVQTIAGAEGNLRFEIESQGQVVALSGTNWRSPTFAEVFVYVHPKGRGRGWGRSVVSACTAALLEEGVRPLYLAEESNTASIRIAEGLGYEDTGLREFVGEGQLK
jgi:GNAT superfamily N-acetyltransferase